MGGTLASNVSLQTPLRLNTLDLAFFRAIQSLQYQKCGTNIDNLIVHVQEAYVELPFGICCKVWTTAQIVMNQILIQQGNNDNDHMLPHVGKLKAEKAVSPDIPMGLPCQALIEGRQLRRARRCCRRWAGPSPCPESVWRIDSSALGCEEYTCLVHDGLLFPCDGVLASLNAEAQIYSLYCTQTWQGEKGS